MTFIVLLSVSAESGSTLPSQHSGTTSPDLFESQHSNVTSGKQSASRKTPESFLGPNAALVNLDSLVSKPPQPVTSLNPFLAPGRFLHLPSGFCSFSSTLVLLLFKMICVRRRLWIPNHSIT